MKLEQVKLEKSRMQSNNRQNIKRSKEDDDSDWHKENQSDSIAQVHSAVYQHRGQIGKRVRPKSRDYGVGFFGVDAKVFDGFGYDTGLDFAVLLELVQGGQGDEAVVDLEEFAQGLAAFAAAEAVGAERGKAARHPFADHVGQRLDVVGGGYERPGPIRQSLLYLPHPRPFTPIPPLHLPPS